MSVFSETLNKHLYLSLALLRVSLFGSKIIYFIFDIIKLVQVNVRKPLLKRG